jgi:hypothetical protein
MTARLGPDRRPPCLLESSGVAGTVSLVLTTLLLASGLTGLL